MTPSTALTPSSLALAAARTAATTVTTTVTTSEPAAPPARPTDLPPLTLTANARTVLEKRYLIKDASGTPIETPEDLFWRVATTVAAVDARYGADEEAVLAQARAYYGLMADGRFLPNSPTLMNAGRPLSQLAACFVLPVEDALANGQDGIYDTLTSMAVIHQSGGGTGFSFSRLRPQGSMVRSTTGVASGPVSFMKLYDASTDAVKQGGTRRGANMAILRVDHPDILTFVSCKEDLAELTNFNISVAVTTEFMDAVKQGTTYPLRDPATGSTVGSLDATTVWETMIEGAWKTGEPGCFYIDEANRYNPVPHLGAYEATNPCGEQPLLPYDVCNLGSINLGAYVPPQDAQARLPYAVPATIAAAITSAAPAESAELLARLDSVNWGAMARDIATGTRFLDAIIDANQYPLPEIGDLAQRIRRIGFGVMGYADFLIRLGVAYDSPEGVAIGSAVQEFVDTTAKGASEQLAAERGTFPEWERSIWGPDDSCARDADGQRIRPMQRLRNCNVTTVAPTGTISILAGCSSGLEPLFAVAFMRNQAGVRMPDVNADFLGIAREENWYSADLMERIATTGSVAQPEVPESWQRIFVTANAIAPEWHVRMQAAFQRHCDSAISKTTNFAQTATIDDVRTIYELAYDLKCKGVTVYRDGSREGQVLSTGATTNATQHAATPDTAALTEALAAKDAELARLRASLATLSANPTGLVKRSRPDALPATSYKKETPLGTAFVHVTEHPDGQPFEVFASLGKAGGSAMADAEAIGRLASLALRSGIPAQDVVRQLRGISSDRAVGLGPNKVLSVPDAIGQALGQFIDERAAAPRVTASLPGVEMTRVTAESAPSASAIALENQIGTCPDCGTGLQYGESCVKCVTCGFSECG